MSSLELTEHGRLLEQIPLAPVSEGGQHVEDGFAFIAVPDMGREGVPPAAPGCLQPHVAVDEGETWMVGRHHKNRNQLTTGSERQGESGEPAIIPDAGVGKSRIQMDDLDKLGMNRGAHESPLPSEPGGNPLTRSLGGEICSQPCPATRKNSTWLRWQAKV